MFITSATGRPATHDVEASEPSRAHMHPLTVRTRPGLAESRFDGGFAQKR